MHRRQEVAVGVRFAGNDGDRFLAIAEIVERRTAHRCLQHLADALGGDAERAGAILVDDQLHRRDGLQPVVVNGAKLRILSELRLYLIGDTAHLRAVLPGHAHLDRASRSEGRGTGDRPCRERMGSPRPECCEA